MGPLSRLAVIVTLVCVSSCRVESLSAENITCPQFDRCTCKAPSNGLRTYCHRVPDIEKLTEDISKLRGATVELLTLSHLNVTTLPAFLFENITVRMLRIVTSALESLSDDAFAGIGTLDLLDLSKNKLTAIPRALLALKGLTLLYMANNRLTVIGGELMHLASSLRRVQFTGNHIVTLHADAFRGFTRLQRVGLQRNAVVNLPATLFHSTPVLELVDLRWNAIEDVGDAFYGVHSLQALYLTDNRIRDIRQLAAARLRSLKEISLDNNPIQVTSLFGPYEVAIESLSLKNCGLSSIDTVALGCLPRLRFVNLAKNDISRIDSATFPRSADIPRFRTFTFMEPQLRHNCNATGAANRTAVLQIIDLSWNKIRDINAAFTGLKLLETLKLGRNQIEFVADDAFSTNENLKELYLEDNRISWLGKRCFHGLTSLKTLYLTGNRLASFNGSLAHAPALTYLAVQLNRLQRFQNADFLSNPKLKFLYAYGNEISDVRGAFVDLKELQILQLQNNSLTTIHRASFPTPTLKLKKMLIRDNPLHCDCQLSWLHDAAITITENRNPVCHSPPWMKGLALLNSTTTVTMKSWLQDCDDRCSCTCQEDDNYGKQTRVNCSHTGLTLLPQVFPEDTFLLDVSGNRLQTLNGSLAETVPRLKTLLLDDNLLSTLDSANVPKGLQELSMRNNRFTGFPTNAVSHLNLFALWLSGNPWACACEDYAFRLWAEANEIVIQDADSLTCVESVNTRVSLQPFMTLEQKDFCPPQPTKYAVLAVLILVVLSVSLCIAVVYLTRKREIRLWLYAHGLRCVKERDMDKDKAFDVFLAFSSKDSDWAYTHLVPGLEEAGFSVCTYDRSFKGGFLIQDIIQEAVACSRRTLLLLTRNFVESEWCCWEFRVAHQRALRDRTNRLIIVVVDKVPEGVGEDLLAYMRVTSYLRWGEKHFWDKLKCSLPNNPQRREVQTVPP